MNRNRSAQTLQTEHELPFLVVLHDVCPAYQREIAAITRALIPLVGRGIAAAVVPNWHGQGAIDRRFAESISSDSGEILVHGWTHQRECGVGLISWMTRRSDEFTGLSLAEARTRLRRGADTLRDLFATPVAGWLAPAWQTGPLCTAELFQSGFTYHLGYRSLVSVHQRTIPLATWTWDLGRFAVLGLAGEFIGRGIAALDSRRVTCLAIHPIDVTRGYLPRIVSAVERCLEAGKRPCLPRDLALPLPEPAT